MTIQKLTSFLKQGGALATVLVFILLSFSACKKNDDNTPAPSTINDLINNGNGISGNKFTILKKAIALAGLNGALSQSGTLTVFAPTDAAFNAFGYADTNAIKAAPLSLLTAVLQYHVLGSAVNAAAIPVAVNTPVQTLSGLPIYVTRTTTSSATSGTISVNGARVVQADVPASNGVIHVIDRVLLPPAFGDIVKTIQGIPTLLPNASFTFLNAAVTKAGIGSALLATGPLTVFAPTDAAFTAAIPTLKTVADVNALSVQQLTAILSYHVVNGRLYTPIITSGSSLTTLQGGTLTTGIGVGGVTVLGKGNGTTASNITGPDITATNGVVHIIDRLLLPQ